MHAIIGGGAEEEEEDGRWEWTVGLTLPLNNGPENARIRVQIYGLWPHRARESERERTIANLRCLVWSIAAESAPAWYAHAGKGKAATGRQEDGRRKEGREGGGPL